MIKIDEEAPWEFQFTFFLFYILNVKYILRKIVQEIFFLSPITTKLKNLFCTVSTTNSVQ